MFWATWFSHMANWNWALQFLGQAIGDVFTAMRMMFRIVGESSRIAAADALMRAAYKKSGLGSEYADMIGAVKICVQLRNQYAHCHWGDNSETEGLFFTTLQEPARAAETFEPDWRHIDLLLAVDQRGLFHLRSRLPDVFGIGNADEKVDSKKQPFSNAPKTKATDSA